MAGLLVCTADDSVISAGLTPRGDPPGRVFVDTVVERSWAYKVGIRKHFEIVEVNDNAISNLKKKEFGKEMRKRPLKLVMKYGSETDNQSDTNVSPRMSTKSGQFIKAVPEGAKDARITSRQFRAALNELSCVSDSKSPGSSSPAGRSPKTPKSIEKRSMGHPLERTTAAYLWREMEQNTTDLEDRIRELRKGGAEKVGAAGAAGAATAILSVLMDAQSPEEAWRMLENCKQGRELTDMTQSGEDGPRTETKQDRKLRSRCTVANLDPKVLNFEYAVRGVVSAKAAEMKQRLEKGESLPFKELIPCNIGNPHAVRQKPITFYRQVAACCMNPDLIASAEALRLPSDVVRRAKEYIDATSGNGLGSYTDSNGLLTVRQQIAEFIRKRDGFPCDPSNLSLTTGASEGVKRCIQALLKESFDGVLIPKPQYPLYSAAITMHGGQIVYYNLDEDQNWRVTGNELIRAYDTARAAGTNIRAIAVINPGNPSGAVLSKADVEMMVTFAKERQIVILADEVYQENVYADGKQFHSFKKATMELAKQDASYNNVQLVSFHSTSKGLIGECGQRGGYAEFIGFSKRTLEQFEKMAATSLSSNTMGQIFCGLMVCPPGQGDPSYKLFTREQTQIRQGLRRRAQQLQDGLNRIRGISCQMIEGAMYGFPSLDMPTKAVEKAAGMKMPADEYWCVRLVEETGIVCVPGSGFGQKEGSYHFRITILPPDDMLADMLKRLGAFQEAFMREFANWQSDG